MTESRTFLEGAPQPEFLKCTACETQRPTKYFKTARKYNSKGECHISRAKVCKQCKHPGKTLTEKETLRLEINHLQEANLKIVSVLTGIVEQVKANFPSVDTSKQESKLGELISQAPQSTSRVESSD